MDRDRDGIGLYLRKKKIVIKCRNEQCDTRTTGNMKSLLRHFLSKERTCAKKGIKRR